VEGEYTFASGLVAAEKLLSISPRPDAIMAANDDMAAAVLWAAHRRGLKLPRDLAVTGFDDTLLATRVWPALTTVRQPIREMVDTAISVLTNTFRHSNAPARPEEVVVDFTIVERESTSSSGDIAAMGAGKFAAI
jgi:LacI family transcriptional regulator